MIRKLASQTAIYGLGTVVPRFINYLLAPYLTYIALDLVSFGVMGYFYSLIPFGVSILTMGMETGFFRFTSKCDSEKDKDKLFGSIWSAHIIGAILLFILIFVFRDWIYGVIGLDYAKSIIPIVGALIAVDVIASLPFARLREQEKPMKFTLIRAVSVLVNVGLVVFFYSVLPYIKDSSLVSWMWIDNFGAGYVFVANLVGSVVSLLMLMPTYRAVRLSIDRRLLGSVFIFSFPLFISGFSGTANDFIDRQLLAFLAPKDIVLQQIGIYSATLKITAIMLIFTQMYRYAAEPLFLSKLKTEDFKKNNAEAMKFFVIAALVIFLGIVLYLDVFMILVSKDFRQGMHLVPILLMANVFMGIHVNLSFWYKFNERTFFAIIITLVGLAITVIINIALIPAYGYTGCAWARLASMLAMVVLSYILNQKYFPVPYDIKRIGEYFLVAGIIFGLSYLTAIGPAVLKYTANSILLIIFVAYAIWREKLLFLIKRK